MQPRKVILLVLQNTEEPVRREIGYGDSSERRVPLVISFEVFQKMLEEYFSVDLCEGYYMSK